MTPYEQGFLTKCAEYGVDGRMLLRKLAQQVQSSAAAPQSFWSGPAPVDPDTQDYDRQSDYIAAKARYDAWLRAHPQGSTTTSTTTNTTSAAAQPTGYASTPTAERTEEEVAAAANKQTQDFIKSPVGRANAVVYGKNYTGFRVQAPHVAPRTGVGGDHTVNTDF